MLDRFALHDLFRFRDQEKKGKNREPVSLGRGGLKALKKPLGPGGLKVGSAPLGF